MSMRHTVVDSPLGELTLVADGRTMVGAYFTEHRGRPDPAALGPRVDAGFDTATGQLQEYFAGQRTVFELELAPRGDEFSRRVWHLLTTIPYGATRSYSDLARTLGDKNLARAVGTANARNPLCVLMPCHRVVGADGSLTGYAGGLTRKSFLLELEKPVAARTGQLF